LILDSRASTADVTNRWECGGGPTGSRLRRTEHARWGCWRPGTRERWAGAVRRL